MNIEKLINEKVHDVLNESLETVVKDKVSSCIEGVFSDLFRSYGDLTKILSKKIEEGLKLGFENLKIESYNDRVISIIQHELGKYIDENVSEVIAKRLNGELSFLTKKEWKLSEILEVFVEEEWPADEYYFHPTIEVEVSNYGSTYIAFDKKSGKLRHDCEYQLSINRQGEIYSYETRGYFGKPINRPPLSKIENLIYSLYASAAVIEVDDYETYYERD